MTCLLPFRVKVWSGCVLSERGRDCVDQRSAHGPSDTLGRRAVDSELVLAARAADAAGHARSVARPHYR